MSSSSLTKLCLCLPLLLVSGCAKNLVQTDPGELPVRMHAVPELSAKGAVDVINVQTPQESLLAKAGAYGTFFADHKQWTDTAVSLTRDALAKRGVETRSGAPKTLRLSIDAASFDYWSINSSVSVTLRAETGNGYTGTYKAVGQRYGHEYTPVAGAGKWGWDQALRLKSNHALTKAVEAMLQDDRIVGYLRE